MEIDLAAVEAPAEAIRSQACVVGAGIAGLVLARKLALRGVDVVVLEAGGRSLEESGQEMFARAELRGLPHVCTTEGRFRVFGGSSVRWGGQVLSMGEDGGAAWPVSAAELAPFVAEAEGLLEVGGLPFDAAGFFRAIGEPVPEMLRGMDGMDARVSKWMAFPRRNMAPTIGKDVVARARVYLHAQVVELVQAREGGRIEAVVVQTPAGVRVRFEAEEVVLAAGTVETARLMLSSRSVAREGVGNKCDQVGRNFHDHPTVAAAVIKGVARERVVRELRPWVFFAGLSDVRGGTLHSVKLEASRELRERLGLNPVLAHVAIVEPAGTGITVVRDLLTSLQRREFGKALTTHAMKLPGAMLEGARLVLGAKFGHRRFISKGATLKLQFNVAQDSPSRSRVTLGEAVDAYGLPEPVVDWCVSEQEMGTMRRYAAHLSGEFERMGLTGVEWAAGMVEEGAVIDGLPVGLEDARHAMGGACMGVDPRTSVVDTEMRVYGVGNLSVASAAVFPDGSPQLPTLTMMALALRLAERLAGRLG
ncbi:MAG: GMC oxidoreductase [Acidobacteriaceae bacterium]